MIRHTLRLRFRAGIASGERDAVLLSLIALCDCVGKVTSLACGPDVDSHARANGFTHAFTVVFGSEEARNDFLALAGYLAAMTRLSEISEFVQVAD